MHLFHIRLPGKFVPVKNSPAIVETRSISNKDILKWGAYNPIHILLENYIDRGATSYSPFICKSQTFTEPIV